MREEANDRETGHQRELAECAVKNAELNAQLATREEDNFALQKD